MVSCQFLDKQYGSGKHNNQSIETPAGTITNNPKLNLVTAKWIMDAQYSKHERDIDKPCFTLIARMDKTPPYLVTASGENNQITINESDSPYTKKIKQFMIENGISDIKMRMLNIQELKRITGFPENYILIGTQAEQKKFIGNAVVVVMAQKLIEACAIGLMKNQNLKIVA